MIRIDRICVWLIIAMVALAVPATSLIKFTDELIINILLLLAIIELFRSRDWKRFRPLLVYIAVVAFYFIYSMAVTHINTTSAIIKGVIVDTKLYTAIFTVLCIRPEFNEGDKKLLRIAVIFNLILAIVSVPLPRSYLKVIFSHPMFVGTTCFLSAVSWLFVSVKPDGKILRKDLGMIFLLIIVGLSCTRAKYYGEAVLTTFLLLYYTPGMLRHLSFKRLLLIAAVGVVFIMAVWQKFKFYFLSVDIVSLAFEESETMARLALYIGMGLVLMMYPLLGSGFGTFCSFASAEPYSPIYLETGLNFVWGLAPDDPQFITDAYYPQLAQFGIIGIILFIYFWFWIYKRIRVMIRRRPVKLKYYIICALAAFCAILIEMTSGTVPIQPTGEGYALILALCCCYGQKLLDCHDATVQEPESDAEPDDTAPRRIC